CSSDVGSNTTYIF
nr:immunoglobulin light chain junction region [Macaca mulatta]